MATGLVLAAPTHNLAHGFGRLTRVAATQAQLGAQHDALFEGAATIAKGQALNVPVLLRLPHDGDVGHRGGHV
jgi:hypothetical protein